MYVYTIQYNTSVFAIALPPLKVESAHMTIRQCHGWRWATLWAKDLLKVCRVRSDWLSKRSNSYSPCYITEYLCHGRLRQKHTQVIQMMTVSRTKSCMTYRFLISRTVSAKWAEPPSVISKRKPIIRLYIHTSMSTSQATAGNR